MLSSTHCGPKIIVACDLRSNEYCDDALIVNSYAWRSVLWDVMMLIWHHCSEILWWLFNTKSVFMTVSVFSHHMQWNDILFSDSSKLWWNSLHRTILKHYHMNIIFSQLDPHTIISQINNKFHTIGNVTWQLHYGHNTYTTPRFFSMFGLTTKLIHGSIWPNSLVLHPTCVLHNLIQLDERIGG